MNAVADTTQANRTSLFDAPWIDGIEAELAKLYRSLQAHQGGLSVEQSSRRCSVESAIDDLIAGTRERLREMEDDETVPDDTGDQGHGQN